MTVAIYPGTFDPITNGHVSIAKRAAKLFDEVIVAVVQKNPDHTVFSTEERLSFVKEIFFDIDNINQITFDGLITDVAREKSSEVIIRGLRTVLDINYEFDMASMNKKLYPGTETVFLKSAEEYSHISSSLIREIVSSGGDVSSFVPQSVNLALKEKFSQ